MTELDTINQESHFDCIVSKSPKPRLEAEIIARWDKGDGDPVVSIVCPTFNQRSLIEDALNGFLLQETDFPFEIIVLDDASTDGTRAIVEAYAALYPMLIRPVFQTENQWSKNIMPLTLAIPIARGKYIALCEGDDYWIDKTKLQKQVAFLEANPDYGLVCTDMVRLNQREQCLYPSAITTLKRWEYKDLINWKNQVWTLTTCFRKSLVANLPDLDGREFFIGDCFIFITISLQAKIHFIPEITSVYRVLEDSASHFVDNKKQVAFTYKVSNTMLYFLGKHPVSQELHRKIYYKNMLARFKYSRVFGRYDIYKMVDLRLPARLDYKNIALQALYFFLKPRPIFMAYCAFSNFWQWQLKLRLQETIAGTAKANASD